MIESPYGVRDPLYMAIEQQVAILGLLRTQEKGLLPDEKGADLLVSLLDGDHETVFKELDVLEPGETFSDGFLQ